MRSITNAAHHRQDGYRSIVKLVSGNRTITEANIVLGGFAYDSRVVEEDGFQVGTAIADQIHVTLDNSTGVYNRSYLGLEFTVSISCVNISTGAQDSWYQLGLFTVTEVDESDSATTSMTLMDRMYKLDQVIPSFAESTLYSNLSSFCSTLGVTLVTTNTNPLQKWSISVTDNENGITYRDFVRGCALLLGRNARFTNDGKLEFTQNIASSAVATLNPSDRYGSRLGELKHLGGVEVYDDEGTLLFSRNLHTNDTYRVKIDPSSSVIFDLIGGIEGVVTGFNACVSGGSSYYPASFNFNYDYYPCEIVAMNWWELQTWDKVSYVNKSNASFPIIVTSIASVLNGKTSITSTADEEDRIIPTQTDETRVVTNELKATSSRALSAADEAYQSALSAMPKYGTNTQTGSTVAKTVAISNFTLTQGQRVTVLFTNKNTATSPTLNVSGTGAYPIKTSDGQSLPKTNVADQTEIGWGANSLVTFVFDNASSNPSWRIDDSAALTKIDHILTDDIVGDNGWINLKEGRFVFNDATTGDSLAFSSGHVVTTGTINATGGTITGDMNVTGTLNGATITGGSVQGSEIVGEEINISGTGDVVFDPPSSSDPHLKYYNEISTKDITREDGSEQTYKGLLLQSYIQQQPGGTIGDVSIDMDPYDGYLSLDASERVSIHTKDTDNRFAEIIAATGAPNRYVWMNGNVDIDGNADIQGNADIGGYLTATPKPITVSIQTVSGITLESSGLRVYTSAGWCAVTIELTSTTTLSDWTTIASGMPTPAANWYDTMESWATTYKRPFRVQVNASSRNLNLRYGDSSSYRISFVYPIAR